MSLPVISYRYNASPFSVKVDRLLLLKRIPHQTVNVANALPRPEITELLGIAYRRIPILAIGNDVYCDTSLIASALERRFPVSSGYGTIFPHHKNGGGADVGMVKAFARSYADTTLFTLAPSLLPWDKFPPSFIEDRNGFNGSHIDVPAVMASRGKSLSRLASHLSLLEEQLNDGRDWLFNTEHPGLADISVHTIYAWVKGFHSVETLFNAKDFPFALQWITRVSKYLENQKNDHVAPAEALSGTDAAKLIATSPHEPYGVVGFDSVEASRLGLKAGDFVQIYPDDTARTFRTSGKLVALSRDEFVIEVQGQNGLLRCHFPRIGFSVRSHLKNKL